MPVLLLYRFSPYSYRMYLYRWVMYYNTIKLLYRNTNVTCYGLCSEADHDIIARVFLHRGSVGIHMLIMHAYMRLFVTSTGNLYAGLCTSLYYGCTTRS